MHLNSKVVALGLMAGGALARPGKQCDHPSKHFVKVKGEKFQLDGEDFYFAGSNAYYFPFSGVSVLPPGPQERIESLG
jgi:mannan endo-1,4-beta-mannosidase